MAIRVVARGIDMDSNPQLRETKIRAVLQNGKGIFDGASFPDGEIEINLLE
ncbi:hypothetical protein IJM86_00555 [bacterium]|nr:hypothetical protein [bacterium]